MQKYKINLFPLISLCIYQKLLLYSKVTQGLVIPLDCFEILKHLVYSFSQLDNTMSFWEVYITLDLYLKYQ